MQPAGKPAILADFTGVTPSNEPLKNAGLEYCHPFEYIHHVVTRFMLQSFGRLNS